MAPVPWFLLSVITADPGLLWLPLTHGCDHGQHLQMQWLSFRMTESHGVSNCYVWFLDSSTNTSKRSEAAGILHWFWGGEICFGQKELPRAHFVAVACLEERLEFHSPGHCLISEALNQVFTGAGFCFTFPYTQYIVEKVSLLTSRKCCFLRQFLGYFCYVWGFFHGISSWLSSQSQPPFQLLMSQGKYK